MSSFAAQVKRTKEARMNMDTGCGRSLSTHQRTFRSAARGTRGPRSARTARRCAFASSNPCEWRSARVQLSIWGEPCPHTGTQDYCALTRRSISSRHAKSPAARRLGSTKVHLSEELVRWAGVVAGSPEAKGAFTPGRSAETLHVPFAGSPGDTEPHFFVGGRP